MEPPQPYPDNSGYLGAEDNHYSGSDYNATLFLIKQRLAKVSITKLCRVTAVTNNGGVTPTGTLELQPMVNQLDGQGNGFPHGILHNVPYGRIQGGANAVILDPVVGDIGLVGFSDRDISIVKATKKQANPGSRRQMDWADGVYLMTVWSSVATTQYVQFASDGIHVVSPTKVFIDAPTTAITGDLTVTGAVTGGLGGADQVGLQTHQHPTAAAGAPSSPTAGT